MEEQRARQQTYLQLLTPIPTSFRKRHQSLQQYQSHPQSKEMTMSPDRLSMEVRSKISPNPKAFLPKKSTIDLLSSLHPLEPYSQKK